MKIVTRNRTQLEEEKGGGCRLNFVFLSSHPHFRECHLFSHWCLLTVPLHLFISLSLFFILSLSLDFFFLFYFTGQNNTNGNMLVPQNDSFPSISMIKQKKQKDIPPILSVRIYSSHPIPLF